jgi:glutamate 5-kinase
MRQGLDAIRRIVVKIGSAVLAPEGVPDDDAFIRLASGLDAARQAGVQVVLVSSGAVACGFRALGLDRPPKDIASKQAAAAVGQPALMARWARALSPVHVAQVLYTAEDLDARPRFLNARRTMARLLEAGVVPIVNENDTVSFAEIKLGDNDRLSALTAGLVDAGLLLILSSVAGLYEAGRKDKVVPVVQDVDDARRHVRPEKPGVGTGGMETKLWAAGTAAGWGIPTVIAPGALDNVVPRVLAGEQIGTLFVPAAKGRAARKRWIQTAARPRGLIRVDAGCRAALTRRGASLLPGGVTAVEGSFPRGAPVQVADDTGAVFARGIAAYAADEIDRIKGQKAAHIAAVLGYSYCDEVIHRDDLVVTPQG